MVQTPCGPRKSGIPESVDTPAPVNTVICGRERSADDMARHGIDPWCERALVGHNAGAMATPPDAETNDAWVVVPTRPGPLLRARSVDARQRDDLDELIDEVLPDVEEDPGPFDLAMAVIGLALLITGLVSTKTWLVLVGVVAIALGAILPARWVWRRSRSTRTARATDALAGLGTVLVISDPVVADLVATYDDLWSMAEFLTPSAIVAVQGAAHQAMAEVASLLDGSAPATDEERVYAVARCDAMRDLLDATTTAEPVESKLDHRRSRIAAAAEVDALGGPSSLSRLADLRDDPEVRGGQ